MESIALSDGARGISELSREIDVDKSAVQRIIQTLSDEGYIEKVADTGRYKPTLRLWELGSNVIAKNEARRLVHPILRYATKMSGLTAYFAWSEFPDIIYLDKVEGERGRANSSDPGRRIPMYSAASGRAVLAFLPPAQLKAAADAAMKGDESAGQDLTADMETVRQRLYATSERGAMARINSVASPVWGGSECPVGSIVLTADASTLKPDDFDRVGSITVNAAEQATRVLGGTFPSALDEAP